MNVNVRSAAIRLRGALLGLGLGLLASSAGMAFELAGGHTMAGAQTPGAPAASVPPQRGTVKALSGNTLTIATDAGPTVTITIPDGAKVQKLAPGSTDLKTATPSQISDIAVGDRVLASVRAGDTPDTFTARTVVLMKSGEIAEKNAADQADWRRNGAGGIVSAIDPGGTITVTEGAKKITVTTSATTEFRRFTGDSVQFKDAKPGTLTQIHQGDQIQARGVKSEDGLSIQAAQVVSGSFKNLSGVLASVDSSAGKVTLKDLATKKLYTVTVSTNSDLRRMPPQMAQMLVARSAGGASPGPGARGGEARASGAGPGGTPATEGGGMRRSPGADMSQMIARMPADTLADLKAGDAVLVVATEPSPGSTAVTAVTVLSGVEPILTANPNGGMNLSSWSMGGGAGSPE
ncbi:MAG: hypothetical protein NVSMB62_06960 [Acidobacteriaceae bacterium]